jgi:hypothetical protein
LDGKQDKLSAGTGITIVENTISSQNAVSAGSNIEILGNVVFTTSDLPTSGLDVGGRLAIRTQNLRCILKIQTIVQQ